MNNRNLDIGIVTDEISGNLEEAIELGLSWGINRFELREGGQDRFPLFTGDEKRLVENKIRDGIQITAVSPGIFKGSIEDKNRLNRELGRVLPASLDLAELFQCSKVIVFGFERSGREEDRSRVEVLRAFERAAEQADNVGISILVENEPDFWVDRPMEEVELLGELDHPSFQANWDPANVLWGGLLPDRECFDVLLPFLANLHVKDHDPSDQEMIWKPVGKGIMPWESILQWVREDTLLEHITLETHCEPLQENTRESLAVLRDLIGKS